MTEIIHIKNLDQSDLVPYKTLRQPVEHYQQGIFIAEGEKVVQRLLESPLTVISILLTPEWYIEYKNALERRNEKIKVFIAEKKLLETIVGFNLHQGIMAKGKLPKLPTIDEVISNALSPNLFVAIDGLTNSENVGVLVRNCTAFGVQALLAGETSSSPYLRRAVRNSMGTVFKLPVVHCNKLVDTLKNLRNTHRFSIIAAHPHSENVELFEANFSGNCCIVFGSEGNGISEEVLSVCDCKIAIPMQLDVDSLNVASASAVFLYEAARQRRKKV